MLAILLPVLGRFWWLVPLAAAAAFGWVEHHEVGVAGVRIAQLEQQLGAAAQSNAQLRAAIMTQNKAVTGLEADGAAAVAGAKAQAAQRAQAAARVRSVYRMRVERIEDAPVPQQCEQAAAWAQQQAQSLAAGWSK